MLIQCLQSHDSADVKTLACYNIEILLTHAVQYSEVNRQVSTSVIPKLMTVLLESDNELFKSTVQCMYTCVLHFPGPCGPFKNKLETLTINILDDLNTQLHKYGARLYASLAGCGGGGSNAVKHTQSWSTQCDQLLASINVVIHHMFSSLELDETHSEQLQAEAYCMRHIPDTDPDRCIMLVYRFQALCVYLQEMLHVKNTYITKIPVDCILDVIYRSISVIPKQLLVRPTTDKLSLHNVLPVMYLSSLKLLNSLIESCKKNLVCHAVTINQLLVQILTWSRKGESLIGQEQCYSQLRTQVYLCLQTWLTTLGPMCGLLSVIDQLISQIMTDIRPKADVIKMNSSISSSVPGSRKRKHNLQNLDTSIVGQKYEDPLKNNRVISTALEALCCLVYSYGSQIKPASYQEISQIVIDIIDKITYHTAPIPYSDIDCQLTVYRVLHAITLTSPPTCTPPIDVSMKLFSQGLNNTSLQVVSVCRQAVASCQTIIHPRIPSIHVPCGTQSVTSTKETVQYTLPQVLFSSTSNDQQWTPEQLEASESMETSEAMKTIESMETTESMETPATMNIWTSSETSETMETSRMKKETTERDASSLNLVHSVESNEKVEGSESVSTTECDHVTSHDQIHGVQKGVVVNTDETQGGRQVSVSTAGTKDTTQIESVNNDSVNVLSDNVTTVEDSLILSRDINDMLESFIDCEPDSD